MKCRIYSEGDGEWSGLPPVLDADPATAADALAAWAADQILRNGGFADEDGKLPQEVEWSASSRYSPVAVVTVDGDESRYLYITAYR